MQKNNTKKVYFILSCFVLSLGGCTNNDASLGASSNFSSEYEDYSTSAKDGMDEGMEEAENSNEGDKVEPVGTNPFVVVTHDPFSTFAVDVDTASYDIFRRDINYGYLPQLASVRLEEFVNYFVYSYAAPTAVTEHPFSVSLTGGDSIDGQRSVLRVAVQGQMPEAFEKKPANVVFLIDVSGSMTSADKLPLVQHALTKTLDVLDDKDTVSIVTYAGNVGVKLPPTALESRTTIESAISSLSSGGSTAGAAGINLAYQQAESAFVQGGINHVILCTDGDFNVGPSSTEQLVSLIEQKRESGITLTVLGFGTGNLNDSMMEAVSNAGNGVYGVIASAAQADEYVENRMLSALQYIAKDMKIQVEFNPALVKAYRLLGYENRELADEDFVDDTVDAGEIGAGHRVTALYEIVGINGSIPAGAGNLEVDDGVAVDGLREVAADDLVLVKVRYKDVDATVTDAATEMRVSADATILNRRLEQMDTDFQFAVAVAAFAEILKNSPYGSMDNLGAIEQIVTGTNWLAADRLEFAQLFANAKALLPQ